MQLDAPDALEYFPVAQLVQAVELDVEVYLPAPHALTLQAMEPELLQNMSSVFVSFGMFQHRL
jgi:hypothetical protein